MKSEFFEEPTSSLVRKVTWPDSICPVKYHCTFKEIKTCKLVGPHPGGPHGPPPPPDGLVGEPGAKRMRYEAPPGSAAWMHAHSGT